MDKIDRLFDDGFSVAFSIGGLTIRWYGLFFVFGFFIALVIGCLHCRYRYKIPADCFYYFALILVPSAVFGARAWSFMIGDAHFDPNGPNYFLQFFGVGGKSGGLAIQGGVISSLIAAFIYFPLILRKPKYHIRVEEEGQVFILKPSMWIMLDIGLPLVLIGQAIGRWGNFFNGELFGRDLGMAGPNDSLQWLKAIMPGVYNRMIATSTAVASSSQVVADSIGHIYQPLFLYESMLNIICFVILYYVITNIRQIKAGVVGCSYLWIYGIIRFSLEPLRNTAFTFVGTYVMNGLLTAFGVILTIVAQFICPRYRKHQLLYHAWCVCCRLPFIKMLVAFKTKKGQMFLNVDPELKQFGFSEAPTFIRKPDNMLYYGPQEYDNVYYYNIDD